MRIPVDRKSSVPLYRQIEAFLRQRILSGSLAPQTRLPATRQMASDLGVNRITVENAYAELEADGLLFPRTGSGTYVQQPAPLAPIPRREPGAPWPLWQQEIQSAGGTEPPVRPSDLLEAAGHADPIDFAGGSGDCRMFPAEEYRKVLQAVMRRDGAAALEYGEYQGYAPLRSTIAHILASQGIPAHPDNVLITAGSQQAISLVVQLLLRPGDAVVVESPTYSLVLDLLLSLGLKIVGVPADEAGMQVERLEQLLQQNHPKLIYTIPNFSNPTGACLSLARRRRLLALADRYNVPILEDDYVGDLRYGGRALPALKALDPGGGVIYVSTFSKMLMPGLRVGFLAAEGPFYESVVHYKRVNDLATSSLHQRALESYVTVGRYQAHLRRSCLIYRRRRDALTQAVARHLPAAVRMDPPQGGLFAWLRLPGDISSEILLPQACRLGVAFAPGGAFFPSGADGESFLRLNFAGHPPETIDQGVQRLGGAIKRLQLQAERSASRLNGARGRTP
ncbi:MAG: PLP-dependent aminotransferase family protein [Acidobacteria bacterium]|nr:PLP-dependent aminotransferase family protein [Acidobacteriota bacterium]